MKINSIKNPKEFFAKLQTCKGNVMLLTPDGDRLNLKSKLCQYIAMTNIFSHAEIGEMELFFSDIEDSMAMIDYIVRN